MLEKFTIWLVVIVAIVWLVIFMLHVYYRVKEENIHRKLNTEEKQIRSQPIAIPIVEGQLSELHRKMKPELEKIERQKQFLRDIMPFINK